MLLVVRGVAAAACTDEEPADWIAAADPLYARLRPVDCAIARQSPPEFTWPAYPGATQYEFALDFADGHSQSVVSAVNWIAWPRVLPAASYSWRVRPLVADRSLPFSQVRRFMVATDALPFLPPSPDELSQRAARVPRPRSLPVGRENEVWRASLAGPRYPALQALRARVDQTRGRPINDPTPAPGTHEMVPMAVQVQVAAGAETNRLLEAALAWILAGQDADRYEARRRCLAIARWNSAGFTSYAANDSVSTSVAGALALAYDWLYPVLTEGERQTVLAAIDTRTAAAYDALVGPHGSYARTPYDSHGAHIVAEIATIGALLDGDLPAARTWLEGAAPLYAHYLSPWGGEDGGYANGTSYAVWDLDGMMFMWDVLRRTTGLDLRQKQWVRNFGRLFAYFMPPGAPAGLFGDGAEDKRDEEWGRMSGAYGARVPSDLMRWYSGQVGTGQASYLTALLAPPPLDAAALPPSTPPAVLIESTGWTAMHASLENPPPFSVYFKSSPYGSYNHSHADQNSFVIHAGGDALAISSGVYDWYGSPHWRSWYIQTRGSNAITYDGGIGQSLGPRGSGLLNASGRILAFATSAQSDFVVGDATRAYGDGVSRALRALAYLRPHTVVIFDDLAAASPHQWEWNLHAAQPFRRAGTEVHAIDGKTTSLCFRVFSMPGTTYAAGNGYTAAPDPPPAHPQSNAVFQTPPTAAARFISVFDTDCASLATIDAPTLDGPRMSVRLRGQTIAYDVDLAQVTFAPAVP